MTPQKCKIFKIQAPIQYIKIGGEMYLMTVIPKNFKILNVHEDSNENTNFQFLKKFIHHHSQSELKKTQKSWTSSRERKKMQCKIRYWRNLITTMFICVHPIKMMQHKPVLPFLRLKNKGGKRKWKRKRKHKSKATNKNAAGGEEVKGVTALHNRSTAVSAKPQRRKI